MTHTPHPTRRRHGAALGLAAVAALALGACGVKASDELSRSTTPTTVEAPTTAAPPTTGEDSGPGTTAPDRTTTTEDSSDDTTTTTSEAKGGGSGSAAIAAYCKAVEDYVALAKQAQAGDTSKFQELTQAAQDLATKAQSLSASGLSAAEAQEVAKCSQKATDILTGPGG